VILRAHRPGRPRPTAGSAWPRTRAGGGTGRTRPSWAGRC